MNYDKEKMKLEQAQIDVQFYIDQPKLKVLEQTNEFDQSKSHELTELGFKIVSFEPAKGNYVCECMGRVLERTNKEFLELHQSIRTRHPFYHYLPMIGPESSPLADHTTALRLYMHFLKRSKVLFTDHATCQFLKINQPQLKEQSRYDLKKLVGGAKPLILKTDKLQNAISSFLKTMASLKAQNRLTRKKQSIFKYLSEMPDLPVEDVKLDEINKAMREIGAGKASQEALQTSVRNEAILEVYELFGKEMIREARSIRIGDAPFEYQFKLQRTGQLQSFINELTSLVQNLIPAKPSDRQSQVLEEA